MTEKIEIPSTNFQPVGENIQAVLQDGFLYLVIDTSKTIGLSTSGKMMGIASTGRFQTLPGGFKANMYIGKKAQ